MQVKWVYENVTGFDSFYSRFNLTLLVASTCLWKKYHPEHKLILYVDRLTFVKLSNLDIMYLWDEIKPLIYNDKINREKLWAGCKSKIVSQAEEPFLMLDHDFLIFTNIDSYLKDTVLYTYDESTKESYIGQNEPTVLALTQPLNFTQDLAANVSLLYMPDKAFANEYGKRVIKNHIEFTEALGSNIHSGYLTLSEQYMLKEMLVENNIKHKTLSQNIFCNIKGKYLDKINDRGIWNIKEVFRYYKHYGVDKRHVFDNNKGYDYDETINYLYRCINSSKLIDIDYLHNKLVKNIVNR